MNISELQKYLPELEEKLLKLIAIPSVRGKSCPEAMFGVKTMQALNFVLDLGRSFGFKTEIFENAVGYIEWTGTKNDDNYVGAICHLDVVPAGEWEDAFKPYIEDNKIIGRGSLDDKGPALAVLYAMKALKDENYVPQRSIRLVLGLAEETGSECLAIYNKHQKPPLASFTADADFPCIHAEKGIASFALNFNFSSENTKTKGPRLLSLKAGSATNVIPGRCTARILDENNENKELIFEGKMGHASVPHMGKNAISLACHSLSKDYKISHPFLNFYQDCIALETNGQSLGIAYKDQESGELTLNVAIVDLDENQACLKFDSRYPVTADFEKLSVIIKEKIKKYQASFTLISNSKPLYRPKNHPLVQVLMKAYTKVSGDVNSDPIAIGGGTYARSIENCLAFGPVMPGDPCLCHQNGEYIERTALLHAMEIYKEALKELSENF